MGDSGDRRFFEGVAFPEDTNISAPWPFFLARAAAKYRGATLVYIAVAGVPVFALGAVLYFTAPALGYMTSLYATLLTWAAATMLAERKLTRLVVVIRPEDDIACIDEQKWWRDDERSIPDSVKRWDEDRRRSVAWLYPVETEVASEAGETTVVRALAPFTAWSKPLVINDKQAAASHIAGIKTTMASSERIARHREPDGREAMRHGLLAVLALVGLLAIYLAGSRALETFTGH